MASEYLTSLVFEQKNSLADPNSAVGRNDPTNQPSGDPSPSAADIQLTRQLREAAAAVDIPLLEHVIVGRRGADPLGRGYYSFGEAGLL
jgi:hypothetical protein